MGRAHRRSSLNTNKTNSVSTNTETKIYKSSFLSDIASTTAGYIIGNGFSRMIFGYKDSKYEDKCYQEYKKYTDCVKSIDRDDIKDRRYNNKDCSILLDEFNKCYNQR